jgi:superfamily II DNA or RNA helicase
MGTSHGRPRVELLFDCVEPPASSRNLRSLLASFGRDGREFERLAKWFLERDPEFRALFRRVWLWDEWPDRWGRDRGIDLVAETHARETVAIQAKNYGEAHSVTKRDLDTFLSESNRAAIGQRLLVASTDRVALSARQTVAAQDKPVSTCLMSRLLASSVPWPTRVAELGAGAMPSLAPKPHQLEAIDAIERWADTGADRGQVIMACGTGKTLVSIWAADRLQADRVLVLVPTLPLLRQTATRWCENAQRSRRLLRICSDRARGDDDMAAGDELSVGGTTDPDRIVSAMASTAPLLIVCTYDSSPLLASAMSALPDAELDLAIADEAHRCSGLEASSHKTILRDDAIRARRRLFFTATPTVYGARDRGSLRRHGATVASMDDPAKFGRVVHRLSFADAIKRDLLCRYQVAVIPVDDDEVHRLIELRRLVTADGDHVLEAMSLATQVACARAMRRFGCQRVVAFHPTIKDSQRFSAHFPVAVSLMDEDDRPPAPVWSEHVDGGGMPYPTRMARLHRFQAPEPHECRLLSNVKVLAEGVDVPGIDAVAFVDTHRRHAAIIQAVGRAVRKAEGKTVGTVVLPVVLRRDESLQAALARSEHRHIVDVLGALRSHDPEIARSLDDLRFHAGDWPRAGAEANGYFVVDAPLDVGAEFAEAVDVALADALGLARPAPARRLRSAEIVLKPGADPSPEEAFLIGLEELQSRGRRDLLARMPVATTAFPMQAWWKEALRRWQARELDIYDRRAIANSLSWMSPDLDGADPVRREMAAMSEADVPEQLAAQLRPGGALADGPLRWIVDGPEQLDEAVDHLREIHRCVTHAAMSPPMQARRLQQVLPLAAEAARRADEGEPEPGWYFLSRRQASVLGFARALVLVRDPAAWSSTNIHPKLPEACAIGARAAAPLTELVREMSLYQFRGDAEEVVERLEDEANMAADERLDALGWDIYLLVRARSDSPAAALSQAMDGALRQRLRVRADLVRRARMQRAREEALVLPAVRVRGNESKADV